MDNWAYQLWVLPGAPGCRERRPQEQQAPRSELQPVLQRCSQQQPVQQSVALQLVPEHWSSIFLRRVAVVRQFPVELL